MSKLLQISLIGLCLSTASPIVLAEDIDSDEDLEYFFSIRQKSTIDNFPLKEIGGEELSGAAIEGALQANTAASGQAKPIFIEQQEEEDKNQSGKAVKENEDRKLKEIFQLGDVQTLPPQFQAPIYTQPTGRTYNEHHTNTVERP